MPDETTLPFELRYSQHGNPATFLRFFGKIRQSEHWSTFLWDHDALEWTARVWREAAIAAAGNTLLRDKCSREADRYQKLARDLYLGMIESKSPGCVALDAPDDWPHPKVIRGAIRAIERTQMKVLQ